MVSIYCIEDINDLKYVGSTTRKLKYRLTQHKAHKHCSSSKLNLYNCIIYELEKCDKSNRKEREKYWINKIDCVNINKLNIVVDKDYKAKWREQNRDKCRQYTIKHRQKQKQY